MHNGLFESLQYGPIAFDDLYEFKNISALARKGTIKAMQVGSNYKSYTIAFCNLGLEKVKQQELAIAIH